MTGYSSLNEQVALPDLKTKVWVAVELKTLNGRFFEVVSKLPGSLSHLEIPLNTILQEKLVRGRIYLNVRIEQGQGALEKIEPDWQVIDQYAHAIQALTERYKLDGSLSVIDYVRLPNVLMMKENVLSDKDEQAFIDLVSRVADRVVAMRMDEGKRLEKDFEKIFGVCAEKIVGIEKDFTIVIEQHKKELRDLLAAHTQTDQQNQHQNQHIEEMQTTLRKIDIHEEIIRFKSHLKSIKPVMQTQAIEKGKRLDFILQELMRETNTMMAKCPAYQISIACIDVKVELEKAREQIQNIV